MGVVINVECPQCHKVIPFEDPNFCCFCGHELDEETKKKYTKPVCPQEIAAGHCDDCKAGKYKGCDDCESREEVEYCPQWYGCFCRSCREIKATSDALSRSY